MRLVSRLRAPKITSGHGDIEKLVRKWCSTNQTVSKPILVGQDALLEGFLDHRVVVDHGRCIS